MSELRIIPVTFNGKRYIVTDHRMQYDWGQVLYFTDLELPDSFEARFSNAPTGESVGQIGSNNRIRIPKQFFESGEPIYCYITLHDEVTDGRTVYTTKVPIKPSSERTEEEPEPEEESIITQAISALNTAVEKTAQDVASADALVQAASEQADRAEQAAEGVEGYAERAESAQTAAESARDRATQAETSARTSAATASEKASEAISSATTASQSALTAENASESAQEYASASAESASQASQSADMASGKASDASEYASNASTSAQTASQKALEAAQSASTAVQANTDAESAKTASQTAQGLAETARNEAVTAKNDAESARDEAQDLVDGITGKVEQIDSNTDRIESLEDDRYKPYPTDTASGSIASFSDGADDIPLKSCIVQIDPVQSGSGDPSPDNVRPISGWTGCEVQRTGKNLADEAAIFGAIQGWTSSDGVYTGETKRIYQTYKSGFPGLKFKPSTQYTVSIRYSGETSVNGLVLDFLYTDGTHNRIYCNSTTSTDFQLVSSAGKTIKKVVPGYGSNIVVSVSNFQIEEGSIATPYETYTGQTYPITFPSEAGTVYGGYIDPINGELVADRCFLEDANWTEYKRNNGFVAYRLSNAPLAKGSNLLCEPISNIISNFGNFNSDNMTTNKIQISGSIYYMALSEEVDPSQVQLSYKLAEPIHYPITSNQINSLYGQNNIWADTGNSEVEYRADTTLYIKRLTESDTDMIADANIVSGQYFMVGTDLYKATVNIASGASVIVGTNATKVSLAQALNEINQ